MKKTLVLVVLLVAGSLIGCSGTDQAKDDQNTRNAMKGEGFDMSKAPPQAKAIIESMPNVDQVVLRHLAAEVRPLLPSRENDVEQSS